MISSYFGRNLKHIRKSRKLTQEELGRKVGVSTVSISQWENGKTDPTRDSIDALCAFLECTESELMGYGDGYYQRSTGISSIAPKPSKTFAPVLGNVAAGDPREAIEQSDEQHWCPPDLLERYEGCFFLRVSGDSMDKVLPDGCYALVAPQELVSGGIYAVKVNGDDATIKRVKTIDDVVVLEPESTNPSHRRMIIDRDDPDAPYFRCLGRVVWYDCEVTQL